MTSTTNPTDPVSTEPVSTDAGEPTRDSAGPEAAVATSDAPAAAHSAATTSSTSTSEPADELAPIDHREAVAFQREVIARQRARFGGAKIGAAFFGWLTAMGTAALLTSLLAAIGAGFRIDISSGDDLVLSDDVVLSGGALGWIGVTSLLVVLLVSYLSGGYVAGRMSRFDGLVQGVAVWVWAIVIAIVVALASVLFDGQLGLLDALSGLPRIPMSEGDLTVAGLVIAAAIGVVTLGGAVLGGWCGTLYHRRIDRAGVE